MEDVGGYNFYSKVEMCSDHPYAKPNKVANIKIAISEKEDFKHDLLYCGFNASGNQV